ncbi:MAG: hypothetical protein OIF36_01555 [Alphaproteobacteria bacterium]|nr:hypothetical protein [Alphaproteobacteria bacterium]
MENLEKKLTQGELMFVGVNKLAYVREVQEGNENLIIMYAADGTELATVSDEFEARHLASIHNINIATVH